MNTEIRNKITSICESVTSNFFYQVAPAKQSYPYCVYSFYGNEVKEDTKDEFQDIYFQVSCYHSTDGNVETLATSIENAIADGDFETTSYRCITKRKLRRVAFPPELEVKGKRLIIEFYVYYEKK